jgi:putative Mn2+ efflux pump MntP
VEIRRLPVIVALVSVLSFLAGCFMVILGVFMGVISHRYAEGCWDFLAGILIFVFGAYTFGN